MPFNSLVYLARKSARDCKNFAETYFCLFWLILRLRFLPACTIEAEATKLLSTSTMKHIFSISFLVCKENHNRDKRCFLFVQWWSGLPLTPKPVEKSVMSCFQTSADQHCVHYSFIIFLKLTVYYPMENTKFYKQWSQFFSLYKLILIFTGGIPQCKQQLGFQSLQFNLLLTENFRRSLQKYKLTETLSNLWSFFASSKYFRITALRRVPCFAILKRFLYNSQVSRQLSSIYPETSLFCMCICLTNVPFQMFFFWSVFVSNNRIGLPLRLLQYSNNKNGWSWKIETEAVASKYWGKERNSSLHNAHLYSKKQSYCSNSFVMTSHANLFSAWPQHLNKKTKTKQHWTQ